WSSNADTFVNTQDTEPIEVTKTVKPSGNTLTEEDKNTVFRYTLSEMIDGSYQPAPHIIYDVYNISDDIKTAEPIRTGVTDFISGDSNTGWGVFTLQHGQKAILYLPKNAYWQITEDNTGKYKLITDESGNIVHDGIEGDNDNTLDDNEATARNQIAAQNYNAKEIAQGFELNSTLDMVNGYDIVGDVVLVRMIYHDSSQTDSFLPGIRFAIKDSKYKDNFFYKYNGNYIPGTSYPDKLNGNQFKSGLLQQTGDENFESFENVAVDAIYAYDISRGDGKGDILWMSTKEVNSLKDSGLLNIEGTINDTTKNNNQYATDNKGNTYQHMTEGRTGNGTYGNVRIGNFDMGWSNNAYLKGYVIIPEMILAKSTEGGKTVYKAYRVVGIGAGAATLWNTKSTSLLKSVTIPKTVTRIGEKAFCNCTGLKTVTFEGDKNSITIPDNAFNSTPTFIQINLMSLKNVAYLGENKKNILTILKEGQQQ
ncbi:MAG: leucine-rich repeat protein, partial [Ruminococcus sp.]|nr:leucine-rich repeat protein [Ruminococcus sp.]